MQDPRKFVNATRLTDNDWLLTTPPRVDSELSVAWQECLNGPFRSVALAESVLAQLGFRHPVSHEPRTAAAMPVDPGRVS
jgi:hypothetical protein